MKRLSLAFFLVFGLSFTLVGCSLSKKPQTHGHFLPEEWQEVVQVGTDTQNTVRKKLGAPSVIPSSQPNVWLYMQSKKATNTWSGQKELERHMLVLYFKESGELRAVKTKNLADGMFIEPAAGRTATPVATPSFSQSLKNLFLRRSD